MSEFLPQLHRKEKVVRYPANPVKYNAGVWRPVERAINFHHTEELAVILKLVNLALGIEPASPRALPFRIRPAGGANIQ